MRSNYLRHIGYLTEKGTDIRPKGVQLESLVSAGPEPGHTKAKAKKNRPRIPPEFNGKDWLTFLLHIDAELEHSLMVQYLYAAYSLGGDHIPDDKHELVKGWQEIILGIAKEEMGHFISVQNVLRAIGAPLNFNRQDFPWDSEMYPFDFTLEPLTKKSLAKYIYAESPENWLNLPESDPEMNEIKKEIKELLPKEGVGAPISVLFDQIISLLEDEDQIPDGIFIGDTYPYQAKFDEWGRGYAGGARGNSMHANPHGTPDVLVKPVVARTDTLAVVKSIAEQGESPKEEGNELSHFERFLSIYKVWRKMLDFNPSRNLAINPTIMPVNEDDKTRNELLNLPVTDAAGSEKHKEQVVKRIRDLITDPEAKLWANLFNLRYRMLLAYLTHSFMLADGLNSATNSPRGAIIHATFGEMYNLRAIANVLVKLPLGDNSGVMAGPPFLIPYTMDLPIGEPNRWRMHLDLLQASENLIKELQNQRYATYLHSLREADRQLMEMAMKLTCKTV